MFFRWYPSNGVDIKAAWPMGEGNRRHELSIHGPSSDRHACVQFRPNQKLPPAEAGKAGLRSNQPSELGARFSGRPATSKTTQSPSLHTSVASASPTNCLQSRSHGRGFARLEAAARGWGESSWGGKFEGVKDGGSFGRIVSFYRYFVAIRV